MTKLEIANRFFFQWFFVRLTRCIYEVYLEFEEHPGYRILHGKAKWYSLQGFILPTSGWSNNFIFLGKRWFLRITKKKIIIA